MRAESPRPSALSQALSSWVTLDWYGWQRASIHQYIEVLEPPCVRAYPWILAAWLALYEYSRYRPGLSAFQQDRRRSRVSWGIGARRDDIEEPQWSKPWKNRRGLKRVNDKRMNNYFNKLLREDINDWVAVATVLPAFDGRDVSEYSGRRLCTVENFNPLSFAPPRFFLNRRLRRTVKPWHVVGTSHFSGPILRSFWNSRRDTDTWPTDSFRVRVLVIEPYEVHGSVSRSLRAQFGNNRYT